MNEEINLDSIGEDDLRSFREKLFVWYESNKRDLPWRNTKDPYLIWISEVVLQQTRVQQGLSYYEKIIERYPSIGVLAQSSEDELMKLWQGLGYYTRARNLLFTAKLLQEKYHAEMPKDYEAVLSLKGIGEYTAAAICSFAYDLPYAVLDGNVYRVLSRVFGVFTPINSTQGKKEFSLLAQSLLCKEKPSVYNQAIMEFGALQCVPFSPDCRICPFMSSCYAYNYEKMAVLPVKERKVKVKYRFFNYFFIDEGDYTYIQKRKADDIWKNLYEFPLLETNEEVSLEKLLQSKEFKDMFMYVDEIDIEILKLREKHILTHRVILTNFYQLSLKGNTANFINFKRIKKENLKNYPVSTLISNIIEKIKI